METLKQFSIVLLALIFFAGCKKDMLDTNTSLVPDDANMTAIIRYYNTLSERNSSSTEFKVSQGVPDWEYTMYDANNTMFITPMKLKKSTVSESVGCEKYLIIKKLATGYSAAYYYFIKKGAGIFKLNKNAVSGLIESFESGQNSEMEVRIIKAELGSNGNGQNTVFTSNQNISGKFIKAKFGRPDGIKSGADPGIDNNYVEDESCTANGGTMIEIEWWYQEFDANGVLIYEFYVFSTFECWGGGGNGGGGGGGTTTSCADLTLDQVQLLMNSITTSEENDFSYTLGPILLNEGSMQEVQPKSPIWKFLKIRLLPGYSIRYSAFYNGKRKKENQKASWEWMSLEFSHFDKTEGTLPPCMSESLSGNSTVLIQSDKRTALANLNFTVNYTYSCFFGSHAGNYSTSQTARFSAG